MLRWLRRFWRYLHTPPFLGQVSPQWLQQYHEATGEAFERHHADADML